GTGYPTSSFNDFSLSRHSTILPITSPMATRPSSGFSGSFLGSVFVVLSASFFVSVFGVVSPALMASAFGAVPASLVAAALSAVVLSMSFLSSAAVTTEVKANISVQIAHRKLRHIAPYPSFMSSVDNGPPSVSLPTFQGYLQRKNRQERARLFPA